MNEIRNLEVSLFSNLHSEFNKFINVLDNSQNKCKDDYLKKIIILNEHMRKLENMIYELKIDIYSNRKSDISISKELEDYEKDQQVIDKFKPFMLYYRCLID